MRNVFALSSKGARPDTKLDGYVFTRDSLVFNTSGLKKFDKGPLYDQVEGGRFVLIEHQGADTLIRVDPAGQAILYKYDSDSYWAVSNSLLSLARRMREDGISVNPYTPALGILKTGKFGSKNSQIISFNTPIEGAKMLPSDRVIRIDYSNDERPIISEEAVNYSGLDVASYPEFLSALGARWVSRIRALNKLGKMTFLGLSGGVDSRATLALISRSDIRPEQFVCYSKPSSEVEYGIARRLSTLAGYPFSDNMAESESFEINAREANEKEMLANAGLRSDFRFCRTIPYSRNIQYIGGSAIGTFSMKGEFQRRVDYVRKQYKTAGGDIADELRAAFEGMDLDPNSPLAMFHHYYQFRARFHYGMNTSVDAHAIQVHPLLDPEVRRASEFLSRDYVQRNGFTRDVIQTVNSAFLEVEFERPDKVSAPQALADVDVLDGIEFADISIYYGVDDTHTVDRSDFEPPSSESYDESLQELLERKRQLFPDVVDRFGFSPKFLAGAQAEIDQAPSGKMERAGVLLGLIELFYPEAEPTIDSDRR